MGKILRRYILREVTIPFFVALAIFTGILFTVRILKLIELVVNRGVPLQQLGKIFLYITPTFLEFTVPMSFLLAILWGMGRLTADREVTALKSCGLSFLQIASPIGLLAGFACVSTLILTLYIRPMSNTALREIFYEVTKIRATAGLKEKTFNDEFDGFVIYAEEIHPPGTILQGVMIADSRDLHQKNTIFARDGIVLINEENQLLTLRLRDGTIHSSEASPKGSQTTQFSHYDLTLNLAGSLTGSKKPASSPQDMSLPALHSTIAQKRGAHEDPTAELAELHRRFALPFAPAVFALLALPLSMRRMWALRSHGFSLSIIIILSYYFLLTIGETLAKKGTILPLIALWLPNLCLGLIGGVLFLFAAWEKNPFRTHRFRKPFSSQLIPLPQIPKT